MTENIDVAPTEPVIPEDVDLTIRQTYQPENDLTFTCPTSWSIKQVKEHIRACVDSHPAVTAQRLIFSGSVLRDEQTIFNVLKKRNNVVAEGEQIFFHLMISQPYRATQPASDVRRRNVNGGERQVPSFQTTEHPLYPQNVIAWQEYWNAYNQLSPEAQVEESHRLAGHYLAYAIANQPAAVNLVPSLEQNAQAWRARVHGHQDDAAAAAAAAPGADQAANNANPGRVDLLEVGYRIFKLVLLFSAILLYSSFERFAIVLCAALFIYFIQLRRNQARHRAQAQAPAAPAAPANQEPHVNNNNNGENDGENVTAAEGEAPAAQPAPPQPTGMQVFLATVYSFVTSFFASLVPDHPIPMDLN